MEEAKEKSLADIEKEILRKVDEKKFSMSFYIDLKLGLATDNLVKVNRLYIEHPLRLDDKIKANFNAELSVDKVVPYGAVEIEVTKEEILKMAKKLGVPTEVLTKEDRESKVILSGLVNLVVFDKLEKNPVLYRKVRDTIVESGKGIDECVKRRLVAKLEEVS